MLLEILANAPAPSGQVSGEILIAVIGAIFSGVALLIGKMLGKKEAQSLRLEEPVPEIPTRTRKVSNPPSWDQHEALMHRVTVIERELKELRDENTREYKQLLEAGSQREARLIEKMDDVARVIHSRIDEFFRPKGGRA